MRKIYLFLALLFVSYTSFADDERVCVIGESTNICSSSNLGYINPCGTYGFIVDYTIPSEYVIVAKYEWFVNGISVKTTTAPSDPIFSWGVNLSSATVYCVVTYKKLMVSFHLLILLPILLHL
jgi:hypothetical protein